MHIEIPAVHTSAPFQPARLTYAESNAVYRELFDLKRKIGSTLSRRERAEVMIGACILRRFDTQGQIVKALRASGLSPNLVIETLHGRTGDDPWAHLWHRDAAGLYRLNAPV